MIPFFSSGFFPSVLGFQKDARMDAWAKPEHDGWVGTMANGDTDY